MHNTPEENENFRRAWDATNARYRAFCKALEKEEAEQKETKTQQEPKQ
jgi:hypothetical protein